MKARLKNKVLKLKEGIFWTSKIKILPREEESKICNRLRRDGKNSDVYFSKCWRFPRDGRVSQIRTNFNGVSLVKFQNGDYLSLFFLWLYHPDRYYDICDILEEYHFEKINP